MSFVLVEKRLKDSSFQLVKKFKKRLGVKVGHSGTLDPAATGLMLIGTGQSTKFLPFFAKDKVYKFKMQFGKTSASLDEETEITKEGCKKPTKEEILDILPNFLGEIEQIPNKFSAIKINGERAYKLARKNIEVKMPKRLVQIYSLQLTDSEIEYENDLVDSVSITAHVNAGFYIRSLVEDIAKAVGTIAITKSIQRIKIGKFSLDILDNVFETGEKYKILDLDVLKNDYFNIVLDKGSIDKLCNGQRLKIENQVDGIYCCVCHEAFAGMIKVVGGVIFPLRMVKSNHA